MKKLFVVGIIIFMAGVSVTAQTVDEIIQKNLEARGGIDKITAIKSGKLSGKILRQGMEIPITMWYVKPDKIRTELTFSDKSMTFAYDGNIAWQISPFTGSTDPQEITGDMADNIKENIENFNEPFIDYEKKGHKIEFTGKDELEGTEVLKLKLTLKSGKVNTIFIDAETFIELKRVNVRNPGNEEITAESLYGDYKPVDGVMTPHSISMTANGQKAGEIIFDSVETNVKTEDGFFSMPPKKEEKKEENKEKAGKEGQTDG